MRQTIIVMYLFLVLFSLTHKGECCTVFSTQTSDGQITAKNFDWYIGEGIVVINPRGAVRVQSQQTNSNAVQWISRYGSVSFTVFAPGFPISGMNEKGLVVESLHQVDFQQPLQSGKGLISLEWVQYLLDNFQSVDEVSNFVQSASFGQVIIPLHFFVSDSLGKSIAVYGQGNEVNIVSEDRMVVRVLANNSYKKDLLCYQKSLNKNFLQRLFSDDAKGGRFGIIADSLRNEKPRSTESVFSLLYAARIPSLIKWQIVWNQSTKEVVWRSFENGLPQKKATVSFDDLDFSCDEQSMIASTQSDRFLDFTPYESADRTSAITRMKAIESATEVSLPLDFYFAFTKPAQCEYGFSVD